MRESYAHLSATPHRLALLNERVQPLIRVLRPHQLLEVEAFDLGQSLIEVGALRDAECAFREAQRRRALFVQTRKPLLGAAIEFRCGKNSVGDFASIDSLTRQQKL